MKSAFAVLFLLMSAVLSQKIDAQKPEAACPKELDGRFSKELRQFSADFRVQCIKAENNFPILLGMKKRAEASLKAALADPTISMVEFREIYYNYLDVSKSLSDAGLKLVDSATSVTLQYADEGAERLAEIKDDFTKWNRSAIAEVLKFDELKFDKELFSRGFAKLNEPAQFPLPPLPVQWYLPLFL